MRLDYVVRWDKIVHVVVHIEPTWGSERFVVDAKGRIARGSARAIMRCGKQAKLHCWGRNHFTQLAPTCIVCAAEDTS